MTSNPGLPQRLSVLDDEDDVAEGLVRRLRGEGFAVERVTPPSPRLEDTVQAIMTVSDAALCDHHLRGGLAVDFSGAEIVAVLTEQHFPSVLFTGVLPQERYPIRRNMSRIPALLNRADEGGLRNARVIAALRESVAEVREGSRTAWRRGRRTPITIVGSRTTGNERLVSGLISGWAGQDAVDIPIDLLAGKWALSPDDAIGRTFMATVNIGQPDSDQLFFEAFDPEPLETDHYGTEASTH